MTVATPNKPMRGVAWWASYPATHKAPLEAVVLNDVAATVRSRGLTPHVSDLEVLYTRLETSVIKVTVTWSQGGEDTPEWFGAAEAAFEFRVEYGEVTKLHVEGRYVSEGVPENARRLETLHAVCACGLAAVARLEKPQEPVPKTAAALPAPPSEISAETKSELLSAMTGLGFTKREAQQRTDRAVQKAPPGATLPELVALALRKENARD